MFEKEKTAAGITRKQAGTVIPEAFIHVHPEYRPGLTIRLAVGLVRCYQMVISPIIRPACRYVPSCSEYTIQAIEFHGILYGIFLGARRILRCHPFAHGGYDPVPHTDDQKG